DIQCGGEADAGARPRSGDERLDEGVDLGAVDDVARLVVEGQDVRVGAAAGVVPGAVGGQVLYDARGGGEFERVQGGAEVAGGPVERGGVAADAAVLVERGAVVEAEVGDGDGVDFDRGLAGDGAAVLAGGHERVGGGRGGGHLAGAAGVDGLAVEGDALGSGARSAERRVG